MALWKDQSNGARKDAPTPNEPPAGRAELAEALGSQTPAVAPPRPVATSNSASPESVIGADLAIEGSISGSGNVRLAGRFTGDVTVDGMVTIESGAKLAGGVMATTVAIAGELEGNVLQAKQVDVHASGALVGDVKADTLTLAAGSRVRGHIDCGWTEATSPPRGAHSRASSADAKPAKDAGNGATATAGEGAAAT